MNSPCTTACQDRAGTVALGPADDRQHPWPAVGFAVGLCRGTRARQSDCNVAPIHCGQEGKVRRPLIRSKQAERETILHNLQRALEAQPRVVFAYVYGSFLEDRPFHDIDVAVYLDPAEREMSLFALELASNLEKSLVRTPDRAAVCLPVDVRVLNRAPLGFCYHAFRGKLLSSRDDTVRTQWVERVVSRYLDLKPLRQRALKEAMTA